MPIRDLMTQAKGIVNNLKTDSIKISPNREVIALIAYMQRLGTDISKTENAKNNSHVQIHKTIRRKN